ncbi:MAG: xanthine dehydrogenase accessory protein XdhC [Chthoniobacterales bacterium]
MGIELSALEECARLRREDLPHVLVTVVGARGSTPQDIAAKMLVDASGRLAGTVGGGKIEAAAISHAIRLLESRAAAEMVAWNLQRDIGMTCGGEMQIFFEPHHGAGGAGWTIAVFGAGHVAQALIPVLAPLNCRILCFDPRPDWLARLPAACNLRSHVLENPATAVYSLPDGAFVLAVTQGHATDVPVLRRALEKNFPFVGAIGSKSKRAALERELRDAGISAEKIATFQCPLGLRIGTNHPHEIAISIAAALIEARDRLRKPATG